MTEKLDVGTTSGLTLVGGSNADEIKLTESTASLTIDAGSGADTITVNSSSIDTFTPTSTTEDDPFALENITFAVTDATDETTKKLTITTSVSVSVSGNTKNSFTLEFASLGTSTINGDVLNFYKESNSNQTLFATIDLSSIGKLGSALTSSSCSNLKFTSTTSGNVTTYTASLDS